MKAAPGELPTGDGWAYEIKWDGMRIVAHTDGDQVILRSSNGIDATDRFPELASLADAVGGRPAILDGEVVAFKDGKPSFSALQSRMHISSRAEAERRAADVPISFVIFDLLHFDGTDATSVPYEQRRALLVQLVDAGPYWRVTDQHLDGAVLLEAVTENGLEGLIAKRLDSPYQAGKRSPLWRKIKVRYHQELVVGGWGAGKGSRSGGIGGLFVGYYEQDGATEQDKSAQRPLRFAGRVGSGLNDGEIRRLLAQLEPLRTDVCPFVPTPTGPEARGATWVRPELVIEVAFADWSPDGRLRHPSYLGQRIDTDPQAIVRELPENRSTLSP